MYGRIEGIILKELRFKDTSKILTLLTPYHGKISAIARGAYRPKSQIIGTTQPFAYNRFILFKGKNFYYINQIDPIESYYSIRENMNRLLYGSYMLELADSSVLEGEENVKIFLLLKKGLDVLSKTDTNFAKFIAAYELKFVSFLGYKPLLEGCVMCEDRELKDMAFSIASGGIVCKKCSNLINDSMYFDQAMHNAMKSLLYIPLDQLDRVKISPRMASKIHDIMVKYILNRIDRRSFNSLDILKSMKNGGE